MTYPIHLARSVMRGIYPKRGRTLLVAVCLILSSWPATLSAHGGGISGHHTGIPIPGLTHGEMAVIAPYYGRIIALAETASDTDEAFRRMLNFAQIQRTYCLWGIMPGSVNDEESPFNECSHAYLAAAKAILLRMRAMKDQMTPVSDLVSEIDAALTRNSLSLVLCKFSGESFNTADLIRPKLSGIVLHAGSLTVMLSSLLAAMAAIWFAARALRTKPHI
ncbi:hypothetical protein [Rhizobium sp. BK602]|uniref:hypothetical protein n=1 Tax=Rhizobium sp. BK602 TaxID=2586986 RepID=UPI0017C96C53|nr:hypothetical protein [Rhizobium sp. BK602]MBB3612894.1 hypothetical protein [Rhizobium sp. BK602]